MKLIETKWWSMPLGDEWSAEVDDDTVIITDQDDVGSLELTVLEMEAAIAAPELQELAAQFVPPGIEGNPVQCGAWQGECYEYADTDYCRDWILHYRQAILLVSYTCSLEHRAMDDAAVDQMLDELQITDSA